MPESFKRFAIGLVAVVLIGLVPVIALAANGNGSAAKPTVTHGPKKTPAPTRTPVPSPTNAPTAAPTIQPTAIPTPVPTPVPTAVPTAVPTSAPTAPPTVAPTGALPNILVGAGDIASCSSSGDEATANLIEAIGGSIFTLGDNVYSNGTSQEFTDCYGPTWGRTSIKSRTRPTAGNHDYNTSGATGYYGYFGAAAGDPTKGYYAYDLGAWRVYVLNSNCGVISCAQGSAQEQWLRGDLVANARACVVAMWHHPRFSSGTAHGSSTTVQPLYQALYDNDAELVLTGHEHNYERFAPQTATGVLDNARGLVEFVVGTGGVGHYALGTPLANSLVRNGTTYGVLRLALSANAWTFSFLPVAGQTFTDSGAGTCH
ncbi:MAG: metallophosphoesterase [Chloroflexota bacterium]